MKGLKMKNINERVLNTFSAMLVLAATTLPLAAACWDMVSIHCSAATSGSVYDPECGHGTSERTDGYVIECSEVDFPWMTFGSSGANPPAPFPEHSLCSGTYVMHGEFCSAYGTYNIWRPAIDCNDDIIQCNPD
jgi:hypothetical protein